MHMPPVRVVAAAEKWRQASNLPDDFFIVSATNRPTNRRKNEQTDELDAQTGRGTKRGLGTKHGLRTERRTD